MGIIESLYSFWIGERVKHPQAWQSWIELDKALHELLPEDKKEIVIRMIEDHCYLIERGGFAEGFKTGMELARELEKEP